MSMAWNGVYMMMVGCATVPASLQRQSIYFPCRRTARLYSMWLMRPEHPQCHKVEEGGTTKSLWRALQPDRQTAWAWIPQHLIQVFNIYRSVKEDALLREFRAKCSVIFLFVNTSHEKTKTSIYCPSLNSVDLTAVSLICVQLSAPSPLVPTDDDLKIWLIHFGWMIISNFLKQLSTVHFRKCYSNRWKWFICKEVLICKLIQ